MEQARIISLDEWPLVDRAIRRFGTARTALEHLRKLGGPPRPGTTRLTSLPSSIETVLEVVGALAANMTGYNGARATQTAAFHIKREWKSTVGPWVIFLLRDMYLAGVVSSVPDGFDVTEHMLTFVPLMLSFSGSREENDLDTDVAVINRASPELHPLIVQVWCKVLDMQHQAWGDWSMLVANLAPADLAEFRVPPYSESPYTDNDSIGPVLTRHIHVLASRIHEMSFEELRSVKSFLGCIPYAFFGGATLPMHAPAIRGPIINAFGTLAARTMSKRSSLAVAAPDSSECRISHLVATVSIQLIESSISESARVVDIMDTGLIRAMFKGYSCLFDIGEQAKVEQKMSLQFWLGKVLARISRFSIYSSVLHKFARIHKKVMAKYEDPGEILKSKSKSLYDSWMVVTEKTTIMRDLRRSVKTSCDPRYICSNDTCPLQVGQVIGVKFRRCTGCTATMYCSYECRKEDWNSRHRERCLDLQRTSMQYGAAPIVSVYEYNIVSKLIETYFRKYAPEIMDIVETFIKSLSAESISSEDVQQIADKRKTPIIFCDLDRPELPLPKDCVRIYDTDYISCMTPRTSQQISYIVSRWRQQIDEASVFVWAEFPRMKGATLPMYQVFQYPLRSGSDP
ncbi:hypothetical protein AAF712_002813 [Marasmius tenuissimus]|uniref:MYND-type domain-containing protein n=1 Tax=Marasmius tenuissimus TaxID=585030 RepID=A0ABR3AA81_9AGAR